MIVYTVRYYRDKKLVVTKGFRCRTTAMWRAKNWVSIAGHQANVSQDRTTFAWFNSPCKV